MSLYDQELLLETNKEILQSKIISSKIIPNDIKNIIVSILNNYKKNDFNNLKNDFNLLVESINYEQLQ